MVPFTLVPRSDGAPWAYMAHMAGNAAWQGIVTGSALPGSRTATPPPEADFIAVDKISFRRLEGISRTDWVPDGSLIKGPQEDVFLIERTGATSMRRPIPSAAVFEACDYNWNQILYVSETVWSTIASTRRSPSASAMAPSSRAAGRRYFIENGKRRHFCLPGDVFTQMGYRWESIRIVPDDAWNAY